MINEYNDDHEMMTLSKMMFVVNPYGDDWGFRSLFKLLIRTSS